jgi:hypothetical protein
MFLPALQLWITLIRPPAMELLQTMQRLVEIGREVER